MVQKKKAVTPETDQGFYLKPPEVPFWDSFKLFLYNSETNEIFGRTGSSWGEYLYYTSYSILHLSILLPYLNLV